MEGFNGALESGVGAFSYRGMKIGCIGWWESSSVIATTHTSPGFPPRIGVRGMLLIAGMTSARGFQRTPA